MWGRDITEQAVSPELDLSLETDTVRAAIQQFNFIQMKRECSKDEQRLQLASRITEEVCTRGMIHSFKKYVT